MKVTRARPETSEPQEPASGAAAENETWFFCRSRWHFDGVGIVEQATRETEQRLYYGDKRQAWRGARDRQSFVEKHRCVAFNVTEDVARAIEKAYVRAEEKTRSAKRHYDQQLERINRARDEEVAAASASLGLSNDDARGEPTAPVKEDSAAPSSSNPNPTVEEGRS